MIGPDTIHSFVSPGLQAEMSSGTISGLPQVLPVFFGEGFLGGALLPPAAILAR